MSTNALEDFIAQVAQKEGIEELSSSLNPDLELAPVLGVAPQEALRILDLEGFGARVVTGLMSTKARVAMALEVTVPDIPLALERAQKNPRDVEVVPLAEAAKAAEAEDVGFLAHRVDKPDLAKELPIGRYYPKDGGPYCTAFVVAAHCPRHGLNLSFHRMMHLGANRFAVRVVKRHLYSILNEAGGELRVAAFCGVHPAVLLAAAISASPDLDELKVASALMEKRLGGKLPVVEVAPEVAPGLLVPAHSHMVFLGRFTGEFTDEGPFVDLTGTYDSVRKQPVLEVETLWMREKPLYHFILPGGPEHKVLMGLPREPSILAAARAVNPGVREVNLTQGGCSWLHAVIQTEGLAQGQAVNVGMAALGAHPSLKKVTIVDEDIDIHSPAEVEWAEATRFQPHRDLTVIQGARGSTLDPSRNEETETTDKWILDATRPPGDPLLFNRARPTKKS